MPYDEMDDEYIDLIIEAGREEFNREWNGYIEENDEF